MPRPKHNFNPPPDLLSRLPKASKPSRADMLKLLDSIPNHVGSLLSVGTNRPIYNAIVAAIRAQKGGAPAGTGAPSKAVSRAEAESGTRSIVAQACAGYKIDLDHYGPLLVRPETSRVVLAHESICALALTPGQARQLAALLEEAADDVDRDTAAREHNANLVKAITE